YAERLGRSASEFDEMESELNKPERLIDRISLKLLKEKVERLKPELIGLSVPFPGNLYSAFKCGQWIKKNHPEIKIVLGGGFANTELRSLSEVRVFNYLDFVTLDDGEAPFLNMVEYLDGKREKKDLKRTFALENGKVTYFNGSKDKDIPQKETGTPDYSDFFLDKYLSVIEIANPMHRLWSDGRWNKLTLAHGCYWGKCTFCDISLDYIKRYEQTTAELLCDRIEEIIKQTGSNGFHFVDEAAPPALMRDLALEILRRGLTVVWWTNIRFEKSFTADLCLLLKESGCIAISGGLEVASDRLLAMIEKGVTVAQVTQVCRNFTEAGIMVHAYLMYGFPTQTARETIDSLEVVRQLFMHGVLQSGFWHQFAMTAHSPVGLNPELFKVAKMNHEVGAFANNDLIHVDETGCDHDAFSEGLKKSLFNYMHGIGFDFPLDKWFDFSVPRTIVSPDYIEYILSGEQEEGIRQGAKIVWLGNGPSIRTYSKNKKGKPIAMAELSFAGKKEDFRVNLREDWGNWLYEMLPKLSASNKKIFTLQEMEQEFNSRSLGSFESFWGSEAIADLRQNGLLLL
ncbi:MAG: B12-binding domain-containing radical SAM protein, partial [Cytophagaceae bacterium]